MARIYFDDDANLSVLDGLTIAVIGYGNQGRAQALNLRDSGVAIVVGGLEDEALDQAGTDGFPTMSIGSAVSEGDVVFLLLPDEVQREIYGIDVVHRLRPGHTLNFAHGYNVRFGYIRPPQDVDVIMVAPRMIGVGVREHFVAGGGAPAFVAVEQDASGRAWSTTLALAKAIGSTRAGALRTTFAEETELDLFSEQAVWPAILSLLTTSYDLLTDQGYQAEAVLMEAYASGEAARVFQKMAEVGLFGQMRFHSRTSQYGTLTRSKTVLPLDFRSKLEETIEFIRDGSFADEWEAERARGYPVFDRLKVEALEHPINRVEQTLRPV